MITGIAQAGTIHHFDEAVSMRAEQIVLDVYAEVIDSVFNL